MHEVTIIKWAAGAAESPSSEVAYQDDDLAQALLRHKLTGRMLSRAKAEGPTWVTQTLFATLEGQQAQIERAARARLEQIDCITSSLMSPGCPLVLLKGPGVQLLLGQARPIRHSGDIDVLWKDPESMRKGLLELGYRGSDDYCRSHEYTSMYLDGKNVDVHRYFPVSSVNRDAPPPSTIGEHDRTAATPTGRLNESEIPYEEFVRYGVRPEEYRGLLVVPGHTLAAFTICVHLFREYSQSSIPLPYATVRLGEMAEMVDLVESPAFDAGLFDRFVLRYSGQLSVDFTAHMVGKCLGKPNIFGQRPSSVVFPYDLWPSGFVVADSRAANESELLYRENPDPLLDLCESLQATTVRASERQDYKVYPAASEQGSNSIEHVLVLGEMLPLTVQMSWEPQALIVGVTLLQSGFDEFRISTNFGDVLYEVACSPFTYQVSTIRRRNAGRRRDADRIVKWKASVPALLRCIDGGFQVELEFAWDELLQTSNERSEIPMLLGVRTIWSEGSMRSTGVLLPLVVAH